jgi:hypothetical protein
MSYAKDYRTIILELSGNNSSNTQSMNYHKPFFVLSTRILRLVAAGLLTVLAMNGNLRAQTLPPNIGFSGGNFNNWTCWVGIAVTGTPATGVAFNSGVVCAPINGSAPGASTTGKSRHFITSGSDTDYYGGFPIVAPAGGTYSLRIGTDSNNTRAERVQYFVHVPAGTTSYNLQCQFAIVMEDPGHSAEDQPTFQVVAYDSATGSIIPAANNLYVSKYMFPGGTMSSLTPYPYYLPWTTSTINLSGMGGKTVVLECTALACSLGGHWGYGYFDVTSAEDSLVASLVSYNLSGDSATLQGPPGYRNYRWYNQDFSKPLNYAADTFQTTTLPLASKPEYYNLVIVPYDVNGTADTIRSPLLKASSLRVAPLSATVATLHPNPVRDVLHLDFPTQFAGLVSLYNPLGSCVYSAELTKQAAHDIPVAALPAGIYTLVLKDREGVSSVAKVQIMR